LVLREVKEIKRTVKEFRKGARKKIEADGGVLAMKGVGGAKLFKWVDF